VETRSGLRSVLSNPAMYELWSRLVGGDRSRATLVREHVRPTPGARVLDLGCGPGDLVRFLGDVRYIGIDASEAYVERGRRLFGERAEFRVGDATQLDDDFLRGFDLVLGFGLVHHLDDDAARAFWREAAQALRPSGRAVAVDPTLTPRQPKLARLALSADRGQRVRTPKEYAQLAETAFPSVLTTVRSDLLRIPYTHCVIEAST
jgi:SAM-dependent methyltransferase